MKIEKCPHCGQPMPLTEEQKKTRIKIKKGSLISSEYYFGAYAWYDEEEGEGGVVGQSKNERTEAEMLELIRSKESENSLEKEYWAIELAAILIAKDSGEEYSEDKSCWIWSKTKLKTLIAKAEGILNGDE